MGAISHRDRVLTALSHEEPDRVPIDMPGIHVRTYRRLLEHLGLHEELGSIEVGKVRSHMASPSEAVMQRLGIDVRHIGLGEPEFTLYQRIDDNSHKDDWGVVWQRAGREQPIIARHGPFQDKEPTIADVERHNWPDPRDSGRTRGLREKAQRVHQDSECAVVLNLPYNVLREGQRLRGFGEFMGDLLAEPKLADAIMERSIEVSVGIAEAALEQVGDVVDVVQIAEDMGTQQQLFMNPRMYRQILKPYHRRLVQAIKSRTPAKVLLHSDGAIYDIIRDFIDIGVDILNPVQVSAKGLEDTAKLKAEFGKDLCFWGAIDTHRILPFGTADDVASEVRKRIDDLGRGGGYVLAAVHTIMAEVPPENIVAMLEATGSHRPHNS